MLPDVEQNHVFFFPPLQLNHKSATLLFWLDIIVEMKITLNYPESEQESSLDEETRRLTEKKQQLIKQLKEE